MGYTGVISGYITTNRIIGRLYKLSYNKNCGRELTILLNLDEFLIFPSLYNCAKEHTWRFKYMM